LCVLGVDPFGDYLDEAVRGESVGEHPVLVRRPRDTENARECHILFVSESESSRMRPTLSSLDDLPILTVSDVEDFVRLGGVVQFFTQEDRIRLRINAGAARDAGLSISSKLLNLAEVVQRGGS
ncbi:MAG TPA: YfiR family protein, partial [Rhodothermales bacterium]